MPYLRSVRFLEFSYLACVLFSLGILGDATAQGMPSELPKIVDLKTISYEQIGQADLSTVPSYQDLVNTARLPLDVKAVRVADASRAKS
jgi:hypothetical protein